MTTRDYSNFWDNYPFAVDYYVGAPVTKEMIDFVEKETGYKLPQSYIDLLQSQNGGAPFKNNYRTTEPNSWSKNRVSIVGILGIDPDQSNSVIGETGTAFMIEEWGYPPIGLYICDTPTAGHHIVMLDYRESGPTGEPKVVFVDQEDDYKITLVAENFQQFIEGLEHDDAFEESDKATDDALLKLQGLNYSIAWKDLLSASQHSMAGRLFNSIVATAIVQNEGVVVKDSSEVPVLFDFCVQVVMDTHKLKSAEELMNHLNQADIREWTGDLFFQCLPQWWNQRIAEQKYVKLFWGGYKMSKEFERELKRVVVYY